MSDQRQILEVLRSARQALNGVARFNPEGNVYHDDEGHFTGTGGHTGRKPKPPNKGRKPGDLTKQEARKQERQKKLEEFRKDYKSTAKDLKKGHVGERKELTKTQKKEWGEQKKEHAKDRKEHRTFEKSDRKELIRDHKKAQRELIREQKAEIKHEQKSHERNVTKIDKAHEVDSTKLATEQLAKTEKLAKAREQGHERPDLEERLIKQTEAKQARLDKRQERQRKDEDDRHDEEMANFRESHAKALEDAKSDREFDRGAKVEEHREARKAIKTEQAEWRSDMRQEHKEQRQELREQHKQERDELVQQLHDELDSEEFSRKSDKKPSAERSINGLDHVQRSRGIHRRLVSDNSRLATIGVERRFSIHRTHKASSAESIVRHCLRQRGWTRAFRLGELSDEQHLDLLDDARQYGRAWLHHEAESLFRHYGHADEQRSVVVSSDDLGSGVCSGPYVLLEGVSRALGAAMARHVGRFFDRAKAFVRELTLAGAMLLHGAEPLTADEIRDADQMVQIQVAYLDRFQGEVIVRPPTAIAEQPTVGAGLEPMSKAQFAARAEQYGGSCWGDGIEIGRRRLIRGGVYTEEMRKHGRIVDDMCPTCSEAVAKGWQPIGSLPRISESECRVACHCYFRYRDRDGNEATTVRVLSKRRKAS